MEILGAQLAGEREGFMSESWSSREMVCLVKWKEESGGGKLEVGCVCDTGEAFELDGFKHSTTTTTTWALFEFDEFFHPEEVREMI